MLDSVLRPSAIDGLIRLRRAILDAPHLSPSKACEILRGTYASGGLDYASALHLHDALPPTPEGRVEAFRFVVEWFVVTFDPPWIHSLRRGRDGLSQLSQPDVMACFDRTGAMEDVPTPDAVEWFDKLVSRAYLKVDTAQLASGRKAERLSYELERKALGLDPCAPTVRWVALNDNAAGYDVRSAIRRGGCYVPKLIEVKASQQDPARIFISRHEWNTAKRMGELYVFHVWHLPKGRVREITAFEMALDMPDDRGHGLWQNVEVTVRIAPMEAD